MSNPAINPVRSLRPTRLPWISTARKGGGERLHEWMAGNGTDGEVDVAVRREVTRRLELRSSEGARSISVSARGAAGRADLRKPVTGTVTHLRYRVQRGLQGGPSRVGHVHAYQTISSRRALSVMLRNQ